MNFHKIYILYIDIICLFAGNLIIKAAQANPKRLHASQRPHVIHRKLLISSSSELQIYDIIYKAIKN